jgi:hypothetical protein
MSAPGQTRRFRDVRDMSGLPQTADISGPGRHFAFVPRPDISRVARAVGLRDDEDQSRTALVRLLDAVPASV